MFGIKILIATAISQLALAQQSLPVEYISIEAGEGGLYFIHPELPAGIGDVIAFSFGGPGPMNHSVVQSTFDDPCVALPGGFYSGFVPVAPGAQGASLTFLLTINSTDPIYYYCGQIGHCQAGMVGVINPPCDGSRNFGDYQSAAKMVTSVGPLPSAVWGGIFTSGYPFGTPTNKPGPSYTGFSASCTIGVNSSSNTTTATTVLSAPQPVFSSEGKCVYGSVSFMQQKLPSVLWLAVFQFGVIGAFFMIL